MSKILGRLFSKADEAAKALKREKGTGAEFLREIEKTPGVKPAEIKERKLDKVLPAMGKTTKAEVLKKLEQNAPPKIEETVRGSSGLDVGEGLHVGRYNNEWAIYRLDEGDSGSPVGGTFSSKREAEKALSAIMEDLPSKYGEYTLPGGENYREILLRLPSNRPSIKNMGRLEYDAAVRRADELGIEDYRSSHWEEPNVLAHARVTDRTGPNGEKILHVEEIQSDWHQQGRKQGYRNPEAEAAAAEAKKAYEQIKERAEYSKGMAERYEQALNSPESANWPETARETHRTFITRFNNAYMEQFPELLKAQRAMQEAQAKVTTGVPDAPFKKNWHELTMKRLLDYAADKGYDKIAITPGAEQAKRYKLSNVIDEINVTGRVHAGTGEQTKSVALDTKDGRSLRFGVASDGTIDNVSDSSMSNFIGKSLDEVVGKDISNKIMTGGTQTITGQGLEIGGEGMKGFYDQILPTYLNNLGKPYGASVGKMPIQAGEKASNAPEHFGFTPVNVPNTVEVHTFDITPQMREEIKAKGLPLYQVAAPVAAGAAAAAVQEPAEPEYRKGGPVKRKVKFSTNPDAMRLELMSRGR